MGSLHLHIVCHDVPYPADYGGVFDLFYKIKALHSLGVSIHLHCFEYGRGEQPALNTYCETVHYYPRRTGHKGFSHRLPYIVCSRSNPELQENLLKDDYPILLEGVHCTYLLNDNRFAERKIFLRLHNVESTYYRELAACTRSWWKKLYYLRESASLAKYEKEVAAHWPLLAVSSTDAEEALERYDARDVSVIPVFLPYEDVLSLQGTGCYCLYHGNLGVEENEKAARWLMEKVFDDLHVPLILAGKNPSAGLRRMAESLPQVCLIADPSEPEMQEIIAKAQIHVIPSFNCTGVKLKLINALFNGRHCVVNEEAVSGTGLAEVCNLARSAEDFKRQIERLYERPFTIMDIRFREEKLLPQFDNRKAALELMEHLF